MVAYPQPHRVFETTSDCEERQEAQMKGSGKKMEKMMVSEVVLFDDTQRNNRYHGKKDTTNLRSHGEQAVPDKT